MDWVVLCGFAMLADGGDALRPRPEYHPAYDLRNPPHLPSRRSPLYASMRTLSNARKTGPGAPERRRRSLSSSTRARARATRLLALYKGSRRLSSRALPLYISEAGSIKAFDGENTREWRLARAEGPRSARSCDRTQPTRSRRSFILLPFPPTALYPALQPALHLLPTRRCDDDEEEDARSARSSTTRRWPAVRGGGDDNFGLDRGLATLRGPQESRGTHTSSYGGGRTCLLVVERCRNLRRSDNDPHSLFRVCGSRSATRLALRRPC